MTAITPLNIPVTVNTSDVAPAMKKVEKTVADTASRLSRIRGAVTPALGALGLGQGASVLGGFTQMGGPVGGAAAGVGALLGGLALPLKMAQMYISGMASASAGATEAMEQFARTGSQTFAANSVMLQQYAAMEQRAQMLGAAQDKTSFTGNIMATAARGASSSWVDREMMVISEGWKSIGAFLGTIIGGGSFKEASLAEQLANAMSETEAKRLQAEIERTRRTQVYNDPWATMSANALASIDRKL